jgi:tripeptidyl-peptidase-1
MKYALVAGLLAIAGVNGARTSFVMPQDGEEPVEHLRRVPQGWNDVGAPSADHNMHFRVAVRSVSDDHTISGTCLYHPSKSLHRISATRITC